MRLTGLVAGILGLILAGYATSGVASRAAGVRQEQGPGPQAPVSGDQNQQAPAAQQLPPQSPQALKVQTTLVNVFATVRDKHKGIISDLTGDDFKIYEDGQEQKVAYFAKETDLPLTLALLMDTSGSMDRVLPMEQDAASRFVKEIIRKKDEAVVISFDFDINLLADFTEDTSVLERAIRRTQISAVSAGGVVTPGTIPNYNVGGTDLYDAVYLAAHDELASQAGRKAIILMTDAEDTGSKTTMEESIEAAQRADTVIHVLLIRDFMATSGVGPGVAARMTQDTGGRVVDVHNEKSLEQAFDEISQELRSQYVLGYYPTNIKHDGTFRKIRVEVSRPDAKVLARKGYYAPVS
jgi:VWFA-related protein